MEGIALKNPWSQSLPFWKLDLLQHNQTASPQLNPTCKQGAQIFLHIFSCTLEKEIYLSSAGLCNMYNHCNFKKLNASVIKKKNFQEEQKPKPLSDTHNPPAQVFQVK